MQTRQLTVLVCPLDWGLGHASRMIPVISRFITDGHKVIIAGTGRSGELLKITFPGLPFLTLPSPVIHFGKGRNSYLGFSLRLPGLILSAFREHNLVKKLVCLHHIDIVVSDNRYGLYCRSAYTIFVTHQISPVLPGLFRWLEYPLYRFIRRIINLYDACWIPDYEDPFHNLTGKLSHRYTLPSNARYIGILSRFSPFEIVQDNHTESHYDLAVVLSGPEPQISVFEMLVCNQLKILSKTAIVFRGMRRELNQLPKMDGTKITLVSHPDTNHLARVLRQADYVLCRSGYSGIMDLVSLGIQAILVPAPGQSEQEYLAAHLTEKGWFHVVHQNKLDLSMLMINKVEMKLPDFSQTQSSSSSCHFQDLYRKYGYDGDKSHEKP